MPARQVNARTILVDPPEATPPAGGVALYARVSSHEQSPDLDGQVARMAAFAATNGFTVTTIVREVGSGMSGRRVKLCKLLSDPSVKVVIVEHRDRLGRMNTELVESALASAGRSLIVVNPAELDDDLVRDMTEVLTSFCARLYGKRSAANRAARALAAAEKS